MMTKGYALVNISPDAPKSCFPRLEEMFSNLKHKRLTISLDLLLYQGVEIPGYGYGLDASHLRQTCKPHNLG